MKSFKSIVWRLNQLHSVPVNLQKFGVNKWLGSVYVKCENFQQYVGNSANWNVLLFLLRVFQPGPGTVCCGSRIWVSTTWRFCQQTCLMTRCTSAKPPTPRWGPEEPNSPSSVRLCSYVRVGGRYWRRRVSNHAFSPLQSLQTTRWSMGVQRCCWTRGSSTTWAVCLEGPNRLQ